MGTRPASAGLLDFERKNRAKKPRCNAQESLKPLIHLHAVAGPSSDEPVPISVNSSMLHDIFRRLRFHASRTRGRECLTKRILSLGGSTRHYLEHTGPRYTALLVLLLPWPVPGALLTRGVASTERFL